MSTDMDTFAGLPYKRPDFNEVKHEYKELTRRLAEAATFEEFVAAFEAIEAARREPCKPHMILLHTVKGRGVGFIERLGAANHNTTLNAEQTEAALAELG